MKKNEAEAAGEEQGSKKGNLKVREIKDKKKG